MRMRKQLEKIAEKVFHDGIEFSLENPNRPGLKKEKYDVIRAT